MINSSSAGQGEAAGARDFGNQGRLAAVFYADEGSLLLSGSLIKDEHAVISNGQGANTLIKSSGGNAEFKLIIKNGSDVDVSDGGITFNFSRNSSQYIRRVFSTNPQLVNDSTVAAADRKTYWLGETFDAFLNDTREGNPLLNDANNTTVLAFLAPLETGTTNWSDNQT